jgi:hypothetical protein
MATGPPFLIGATGWCARGAGAGRSTWWSVGPGGGDRPARIDVYTQNRRLWARRREKGGKRHAMPCHHNLDGYLVVYLDAAGCAMTPRGPCSARSFMTVGAMR